MCSFPFSYCWTLDVSAIRNTTRHLCLYPGALPGYAVAITVGNAIKNRASNEEILTVLKDVPNPNQEDDDGQLAPKHSPSQCSYILHTLITVLYTIGICSAHFSLAPPLSVSRWGRGLQPPKDRSVPADPSPSGCQVLQPLLQCPGQVSACYADPHPPFLCPFLCHRKGWHCSVLRLSVALLCY